MAKGISLHIGLNSVDPKGYSGWSGPLNACEADATDLEKLAQSRGFTTNVLLTKDATRKTVEEGFRKAAASLEAGDIFFVTYSGHGSQLPDLNFDENDNEDETWCLFDSQFVDDEIYALLGEFKAGVRILSLSDSCHSGTVLKSREESDAPVGAYRAMPDAIALNTYRDRRSFYDPILTSATLKAAAETIKASAMLISACKSNQLAADGKFNGLFTGTLFRVWDNGRFAKPAPGRRPRDYAALHGAILELMPRIQSPDMSFVGPRSPEFEAQVPFTIG